MEVRQIDPNVAKGRRKGSRLTLQENPLHAVEGFKRIGKRHFIPNSSPRCRERSTFLGCVPISIEIPSVWDELSRPESADAEHAEDFGIQNGWKYY